MDAMEIEAKSYSLSFCSYAYSIISAVVMVMVTAAQKANQHVHQTNYKSHIICGFYKIY